MTARPHSHPPSPPPPPPLLPPAPQPFLCEVPHPAPGFRGGAARKTLVGNDAAEKIARAVTFGAVAEGVDQIGAAIPLRRPRSIRGERLTIHEQQFPYSDSAPD